VHVFLALPKSTLAITVTDDTRTGTLSASIEMWRRSVRCMASRWARISDRIRIVTLAPSQWGLGYPRL